MFKQEESLTFRILLSENPEFRTFLIYSLNGNWLEKINSLDRKAIITLNKIYPKHIPHYVQIQEWYEDAVKDVLFDLGYQRIYLPNDPKDEEVQKSKNIFNYLSSPLRTYRVTKESPDSTTFAGNLLERFPDRYKIIISAYNVPDTWYSTILSSIPSAIVLPLKRKGRIIEFHLFIPIEYLDSVKKVLDDTGYSRLFLPGDVQENVTEKFRSRSPSPQFRSRSPSPEVSRRSHQIEQFESSPPAVSQTTHFQPLPPRLSKLSRLSRSSLSPLQTLPVLIPQNLFPIESTQTLPPKSFNLKMKKHETKLTIHVYDTDNPKFIKGIDTFLKKCFESDNIGYSDPSTVYTVFEYYEPIATCMITLNPDLPLSLTTSDQKPQDMIKALIPSEIYIPNYVYLYNVCTDKKFRGYHIQEKLLQYLFNDLKNTLGVPLIIYLFVYTDNTSAITLYNRLGFTNLGSFLFYVQQAYLMYLEIF